MDVTAGATPLRPAPGRRQESASRQVRKGRRMPGLVDGKLRAVWQADCREKPLALIGETPGHSNALAVQHSEACLNVVTQEVELVMARTVG